MKVVCIDNTGYPAALEVGKAYETMDSTIGSADACEKNLLRVIDESGSDYLYPKRMFAVPEKEAEK